jgi:hypothetical protein
LIGALRVSLAPIPGPDGGTLPAVSGARIGLIRLGKGKTLSTTAPQAAAIELKLVLFRKVRPEPSVEERSLVTLSGKLALSDPDRVPMFTLDSPKDGNSNDAPKTASEAKARDPRRSLRLEFDDSFGQGQPLRIALPDAVSDFRHAEVRVKLSIGGAEEASFEVNDVLDKPIVFPFVRVRPARYLNTPVEGEFAHNLAFALRLPEGERFAHLFLQDAELVEGEDLLAHESEVFLRPPGKADGTLKGLLVTQNDLAFDFELEATKNANEHMTSLRVQAENAREFSLLAAERAAAKGKDAKAVQTLKAVLLSEFLTATIRILDGIESTLSGNHEFGLFQALSAALPVLQADQEEG